MKSTFGFRCRVALAPFSVTLVAATANAAIIYVRAGATGADSGASWTDAYVNLQSALTGSQSGDEIRVAQGTYKPAPPGGSQSATFQLRNGVQIRGGFAGVGSNPDARDAAVYITTLSGDINGNNTGNCFHVVMGSGVDSTSVLDGFVITRGAAGIPPADPGGGGIHMVSGSPQIENCRIAGNRTVDHTGNGAGGAGGGLYCSGGAPTFVACTFTGNRTGNGRDGGDGGGLYITGGARVTLQQVDIISNETGRGGGPFGTLNGNGGSGGGVYIAFGSTLVLTDGQVVSNRSPHGTAFTYPGFAGGVFCDSSTLTFRNCIITSNVSGGGGSGVGLEGSGGGAIFAQLYSTLTMIDCLVENNLAGNASSNNVSTGRSGGAGGAVWLSNGTVNFRGCQFRNNRAGGGALGNPGGSGGSGGSALLLGCTGSVEDCHFENNFAGDGSIEENGFNGGAGGNGGAISLSLNSNIAFSNCSFVGNAAGQGGGPGGSGGGLASSGSMVTIRDSTFRNNDAGNGRSGPGLGGSGGGISLGSGALLAVNCYFINNRTGDGYQQNSFGAGSRAGHGGGIFAASALTLVNCLFASNVTGAGGRGVGGPGGSGGSGAGVYSNGVATIINCTAATNITGSGGIGAPNGSRGVGAGFFAVAGTVQNCVVWGNSADQVTGAATVTYSNIQGGAAGAGNIDADPLFIDGVINDLRLSPGSPCIDAARNAGVPTDSLDLDGDGDTTEPVPHDLLGFSRLLNDVGMPDTGAGTSPIVDMGAFEFRLNSDCPADLDGDGVVTLGDFATLLSSYGIVGGATVYDGDLNGDRNVDLGDLAILLASFGVNC